MTQKIVYVCGPLTELAPDQMQIVKGFYTRIGDLCEQFTGSRGFVPHEFYDPVTAPQFTPEQVDAAERQQVCEKTSLMIVCVIAPSWGGGIEVEMANRSGVPVVLLCEREKLHTRKISRLLRGNPAVRCTIGYDSHEQALFNLQEFLRYFFPRRPLLAMCEQLAH